jgi:hypothetical protein
VLEGIDGRSHVARGYAEVAGAIAVDLGGEDHLTELRRHLVRSVAGLVVLREDLDAKAVNGERVNTAQYWRLANSTRGLLPPWVSRAWPRTSHLTAHLRR